MLTFAEADRIKKMYGLPSYVKDAELEITPSRPADYADPVTRQYPVHTKTACYLSNAKFWESAVLDNNAIQAVGQELLKMADFWGISKDVQANILTKVNGFAKTAAINDSDYLIANETTKLFPVIDEQTTKLAADSLYESRHQLPLAWKRTAATKLLNKVAEYKLELPEFITDYLQRAAGMGVSTTDELSSALYKRAMYLKLKRATKEANAVKDIAHTVKRQKPSRELCTKVAAILDSIDSEFKLYNQYKGELNLPEEDCHQVLRKHAEATLAQYVTLPSGNTYMKEDLNKSAEAIGAMTIKQAMQFERELIARDVTSVKVPYIVKCFT